MKACNCSLPYISPLGFKVCQTCSNYFEVNNTGFYSWEWTVINPIFPGIEYLYNCPKCGNNKENKIEVKYKNTNNKLELRCLKCGYSWNKNPLDKKEEDIKNENKKNNKKKKNI